MSKLKKVVIALILGAFIAVVSGVVIGTSYVKTNSQTSITQNYSKKTNSYSKDTVVNSDDNSNSKKSKAKKGGCSGNCVACGSKCF
jgi:anionic cell wall polymer biosynthesis LytR-Cps2A-Psr (LCP) family protein